MAHLFHYLMAWQSTPLACLTEVYEGLALTAGGIIIALSCGMPACQMLVGAEGAPHCCRRWRRMEVLWT